MAAMDALLKIKAQVDGEGAIAGLAKGLGGLKDKADSAGKGLGGMLASAGGLSGALGSLVPLVSGIGLAAMAKGAINAADDMNDLAQKTGVSVEQLSKFQQAADASGTSIDDVGKAMVKLNRNMATGNKDAAEALKDLGISAEDANGKLKSSDQIMLEVSDKFAGMADGATKSAAAQALFGKSGADLIPLLNGGRDAVEGLSATMSTKFAKSADGVNDKLVVLQTKLLQLAVKLGTQLMPTLEKVTDVLVSMADGFAAMPEWAQNGIMAVGGLALAMGPLVKSIELAMVVINALKMLQLGAIIGGWAGAIGPAMGVISAAFTGLLAFLTGTVLPALLAFFSGPVGWTVLAVAAVIAMCIYFREPIGKFLTWAGDKIGKGWAKVVNTMKKPIVDYFDFWMNGWKKAGEFVTGAFTKAKDISKNLVQIIGGFMTLVFTRVVTGAVRAFNSAINTINTIISNLKNVPFIGEPLRAVGLIPQMKIPKFAQGGIVSRPTVAMVGEGGESEYIIPESKLRGLYDQITRIIEAKLQDNFEAMRRRGVNDSSIAQQATIERSLVPQEALKELMRYVLVDQNNRNNTPGGSNLDYSSIKSLAQVFPEAMRPLMEEQERMKTAILDSVNTRMAENAAAWQKALEQQRQDQEKQANNTKAQLNGFFDKLDQMNPSITITTGPVLRFNSEDYVTITDLRSAMQATAKGILDSLRNPSTRISLGLV